MDNALLLCVILLSDAVRQKLSSLNSTFECVANDFYISPMELNALNIIIINDVVPIVYKHGERWCLFRLH